MARRATLFAFILLATSACKTEGTSPLEGKEPLAIRPEPFALDVMADPLPVETLDEIRGFDLEGELSCLPLREDACIARADPLDQACAAVQGEVHVCQDCSRVCSKSINTL